MNKVSLSPKAISVAIWRVINNYYLHIKAFQPNVRLYLFNTILTGMAMGIFRLIFNFYVLSLGYDESVLGQLVTVSSTSALLAALPMGYLADRLGRKPSLLVSGLMGAFSMLAMVIWPEQQMLYLMNVISGLAQSLAAVTMSPFLMENSGDYERTYLFSISSGMQMASSSVGNWIGGNLPSWVGAQLLVSAISSQAYGGSILIVAGGASLALLPLVFLRRSDSQVERAKFDPIGYAQKHWGTLYRLVLPMLVTSIGAGLIMPFMNVFFRTVHNQPDPVIGTLFAWGSLSMGLGLLVAPPLADRIGKIRFVVITQGLSIPFLILLGFAPWFWVATAAYYARVALMNMSGPVYQTFVMEHVSPRYRATVASLVSMSWNFGWAFSPFFSGQLQVRYGFGAPFIGTILLYTLSVVLYWAYFWRKGDTAASQLPAFGD